MYKIGVTGTIGAGKTTIASMFAKFNIPIFDADIEIKEILTRKEIKNKIKKIWPSAFKDQEINKNKLKSIIFSNTNEKKKLEGLLYPYLNIEKDKFEKRNKNKKILVYDVPLIYETKSEKEYNIILLAYCNESTQKKRVLARDKISESLFENITKSQLSFDEKKRFNPKIINTNNFKLFILIKVLLLIIKIWVRLKIKDGTRKKINT